jgi:hypothetical protein
MELALSVVMTLRKEMRNMKIATSFLAALLLTGTLGALNNAIAEDGILPKDELTAGSYGHEKSPAIQPSTPGSEGPTLESPKTGDVVDSSDPWYGFTSTDWCYLNPK